jgi:hypothetical protein
MPDPNNKRIYEALVLPNGALEKGGVEILRAGLINEELFVSARRAFDDPAMWGEVLGDVMRRIARLYAAEGKYSQRDALAAMENAFAAGVGAPVVSEGKPRAVRSRRKSAAKRKPARRTTATRRKAR